MFDAVIFYENRHMCLRDTLQGVCPSVFLVLTPFQCFFRPKRAKLLGSVDGFIHDHTITLRNFVVPTRSVW